MVQTSPSPNFIVAFSNIVYTYHSYYIYIYINIYIALPPTLGTEVHTATTQAGKAAGKTTLVLPLPKPLIQRTQSSSFKPAPKGRRSGETKAPQTDDSWERKFETLQTEPNNSIEERYSPSQDLLPIPPSNYNPSGEDPTEDHEPSSPDPTAWEDTDFSDDNSSDCSSMARELDRQIQEDDEGNTPAPSPTTNTTPTPSEWPAVISLLTRITNKLSKIEPTKADHFDIRLGVECGEALADLYNVISKR